MKITEIKKALGYLKQADITALLVGQRGTGKSEVVAQYAKENGFNMLDLRLGQMADAGDVIGLADFLRDPSGQIVATKYMIPHYFQQTMTGKWVLFLDEINRAPKDILQAVFELVLSKSISSNGFKLSPESQIIAAKNPSTDDYTVNDFNDSAFYDRFCFIRFAPTVKEWLQYAEKIGMPRKALAFYEKNPELLEPELQDFSFDEMCKNSRRTAVAAHIKLEKVCKEKGILSELLFGMLGTKVAPSYLSHCENFKEDIEIDELLNDYKKVQKLVKQHSKADTNRSDILKSVCDRLLKRIPEITPMNETQAENLVKFIKDIPKDIAYGFIQKDLMFLKPLSKTNENGEEETTGNQNICIMQTEGDPEQGILGGKTKASKVLETYTEKMGGKTAAKEMGMYDKEA